ncbi:MAG: MGDG synthase family glycosyltransferase, partial [Acidimicrobiales bacterium]
TIPVLLLFADTGGGHRSAAQAVAETLEHEWPGVFAPVLYDPLRTQRAPRPLRWVAGLYGPTVRTAPWAWGALYHAFDSRPAAELLRRTWLHLADAPVAEAVATFQPAAVLSFHPLTTAAAVRAVRRHLVGTSVVTVVTDLVTTHAMWRYDAVDRIVVPSAAVGRRFLEEGIAPKRCVDAGLPVASAFRTAMASPHQQRALRQRLGMHPRRFLVVLAGGAEGSGPIACSAAAVMRAFDDVDVVAICGRNRRLERRLRRLAAHSAARLTVKGFVDNIAEWYRAADLVIIKAGPHTIAEATCCGAALLITSHLPGQEHGNTELVVGAGAGLHTPRSGDVVDAIARLRAEPASLQAMRRAALSMARPAAARAVASLVADLVSRSATRTEQHGAA